MRAAQTAVSMKVKEPEVVFSFGKPERDIVVSVGGVLGAKSGPTQCRAEAT
jgi:hypothetical protein